MTARFASRRRKHYRNWLGIGSVLESLELRTLLSGGPRITAITPSEVINATFDHVDVTFNETIDPTTFSAADASLTGPPGSGSISIDDVTELDGANYRIDFDPLTTRGTYHIVIGPNIADLSGKMMDQNQNGTGGESLDAFQAGLTVVVADTVFTTDTTIGETNLTYDGHNIAIEGCTVTIDGQHNFDSLHMIDGAILTHDADTASQVHQLDLTASNQVIVDGTSKIDVSGKGYLPGYTTGNTMVGGAVGFGGGSYGGVASTRGGSASFVYGDYANPDEPGSGGGFTAGGGLIRITAASLTLDGQILADGIGGNGTGSGGGIWISTESIRGGGSIIAGGGNSSFGAGGGGRVAIYSADTSGFDTSHITVPGGFGAQDSQPGGPGTIYIRDTNAQAGTLIFDAAAGGTGWSVVGLAGQNTVTIPDSIVVRGEGTYVRPEHLGMTLQVQGDLTVEESGNLVGVDGPVSVGGATRVVSGGLLEVTGMFDGSLAITVDGGTLSGGHLIAPSTAVIDGGVLTSPATTSATVSSLVLEITETLLVDGTSKIDVSGKGYLPGYTTGNTMVGGAVGFGGGSYGGVASTRGGSASAVYGDYTNPDEPGSGGGFTAGGGLIRITAASLTLDGQIRADGSGGNGTGSGGGIWISTDSIRGGGSIIAAGGNSSFGAGGGGRVAVYSADTSGFDTSHIAVPGGFGAQDSQPGGPGTIYIRDTNAQAGTLIFDAAGGGTGWSVVGLPGQNTVTIPDNIVVRGEGTNVRPEHLGMTLQVQGDLTVEESGNLVGVDGHVSVGGASRVVSGGLLEVTGIFDGSLAITVDGGTLSGGHLIAPSAAVIDGGVLTSPATTTATVSGLVLEIKATLLVDGTSKIDVSGKGYLPGYTTGNTTVGGAVGFGGGSYGGVASTRGGSASAVFGDYADPDEPGSGGGITAGGGLIRITAASLTLDGQIRADGSGGNGTGSGGGIWISTDSIRGGGSIIAAGGNSSFGAGGGGRVAVYSADTSGFDTSHIAVPGGFGAQDSQPGGPGTIHIVQGRPHTHVRLHTPAGVPISLAGEGIELLDAPIESITLKFNDGLDVRSFKPSDFLIDGQVGPITSTGIVQVDDNTYRINLPFPLTENGTYHFTLLSQGLKDIEGFPLDQNANGTPGEPGVDDYSFTLVVDTIPPRITNQSPSGDLAGTIDHLDVWFSETIDATTLSTADVSIIKPDGQTIAATGIQNVSLNRFRINFPAQTLVGTYHVNVGPNITDLAGNLVDQNGNGIAGEATDDYDGSFHLAQVDLGLNSVQLSPAALTAGAPLTISWSGANLTGAPLFGAWTDAVYLSIDNHWDISDVLLGTVQHSGGLTQAQTYTGSLMTIVPGELAGNYHILVRADIFNQEVEGAGEANNLADSGAIALTVPGLPTTGATIQGFLTAVDSSDYYAIQVPAGQSVGLSLHGLDDSEVNELHARFNAIPTRSEADYHVTKDESQLNREDQSIAFTAPPGGGTFYVLVYGADTSGIGSYKISATTGPFVVTSVTPDHGTNLTPSSGYLSVSPVGRVIPTTVTVEGAGFSDVTTVEFIDAGGNSHDPSSIHFDSTSTLTVDLDTSNWASGPYDVRIKKGETSVTEKNAFTVVQGGKPQLETDLVLPSVMNYNFPTRQTIWIEYSNSGDVPMPAPILTLHVDFDGLITADPDLAIPFSGIGGQPAGVTDTVEVLAKGSGATPGILQPGDSGRIPIYWIGLSVNHDHPALTFDLSTLSALDTIVQVRDEIVGENFPSHEEHSSGDGRRTLNPLAVVFQFNLISVDDRVVTQEHFNSIDWTSSGDFQRPQQIPTDSWTAITANLQQQLGDLWADYDIKLASDVDYLHTIGQDTNDVATLYNFEIAKASASLNPVQYLAGSVDASLPTPGLSLSFSRVYGESITSRYKLGTLGRGWTSNWDVRAEVQTNGDVILRGPGGVDRFFTFHGGAYQPSPGDFGQLTLTNGAFRLTESDQTVWQFNADGTLAYVADTNGNRVTLGYTNGLLTSLTHSDGQQLLIDYNTDGRITHVTNPLGPGPADDLVTTFAYDASGEHLVQVTQPGGRVTNYTYDDGDGAPREHALLSVTYPDGTHDYFTYDAQGRLTSTAGDQGKQLVTYAYDDTGRVTVTDAAGNVTTLLYGADGQIAQVRDGQGRIVNLGYNSALMPSQLVGPSGEKYSYSYDTHGNLTGVRDPLGQTTSFTYDPTFNQITSVTDARGNGMQYGYDTQGNLTSITYADGTHENYTYDASGNVLTATNRRGQRLVYTYNAHGEETSKDDPTTPGIEDMYAYDAAGNLTSATDSSGTTTMTYDPNTNLLTRIDYPGGLFFTFEYDAAGRRTKRTDHDGHVENSTYDALGRLDAMTDENGALIVHYEYDAAGRLSKKTLGNGVYTLYVYDSAGQVTRLLNLRADGSILSRFDYTYDASGLQSSMTTLDGTFTYGYDPLGQLTSVTYPDGHVVAYDYDAAGNRIQVDDNGVLTSYVTNNLNEYTAVGDTTYIYDADGNMTSQTDGGVTTHYTYDVENRLVAVTTPLDSWTYRYDAFGNRIASLHNGITTNYAIDPSGLGNLAAEYDGSGNLIARFDYGYGLLSRTDGSGSSDYYTFSEIGSTSELTDLNGIVINSYVYDPFGISLGRNEGVANPFQFIGEFGITEESSGQLSMRARNYSAQEGRFTTEDPSQLTGGLNLYSYTNNNPNAFIDASGHWIALAGELVTEIEILLYEDPQLLVHLDHAAEKTVEFLNDHLPLKPLHLSDPPRMVQPDPNQPTLPMLPPIPPYQFWPPAEPSRKSPGPDPNDFTVKRSGDTPHIPPLLPPPGPGQDAQRDTRHTRDPNDKLGLGGFGNGDYIKSDSVMPYQIEFENEPTANAPVEQVIVTDQLDANLDLDSFQLTEIDFANTTLSIPPGLDHYATQVPFNANGTMIMVDVSAGLDRATGLVTLTLEATDPATGTFPEDPLVGLLYPDDASGRGSGSISYLVKPKSGLPSGTVIQNRAAIVFDYNDPINTPLVKNTLDSTAPTSSVSLLPASTTDTALVLNWSGQDEAGGSGIATYTIYASVDGAAWFPLLTDTTATGGNVTVEPGHTYSFYSIATDNVGHVEAAPTSADASIQVIGASTTTTIKASKGSPTYGDSLTFTATVAPDPSNPDTPTGTVQFLIDGANFGSPLSLDSGAATSDPIATLAAGSHTISAIYSGDDTFATSTADDLNLTIAKASLTLTAENKSKTYGAADPTLTYTATGLRNGDSQSVISGVTLSTATSAAATAGSHTITATGGTAANYTITDVNGTLTVSQAPLTITADNKSKIYGATDPVLTYTPSGTLYYGDTSASISGVSLSTTTGAAATAGTHTITISGGTAANYAITDVNGTLTVTPAPLTVAADTQTKVYGSADPTLTYTPSGTLYYGDTYAVITGVILSTTTGAAATAGTHTITITGGTAANYAITDVSGTLTVSKAPLKVTADDRSKIEGAPDPTLTFTITGKFYYADGPSAVSGVTLSTATGAAATVGTHPITITGGTAANYAITDINGTLTVTPPTTPPPPLVTMTHVQLVTNKKHLVTQILVTLSGLVNTTEAQSPSTYRLATAGKKNSFDAKNAKLINLKSAVYNPAKNTVTLTPKKPFALTKPVQLRINAQSPSGLQDALGRLIDGDHNGTPGGNAAALLRRGGATISAVASVRSSKLQIIDPRALDVLFERNDWAALGKSPRGNLHHGFLQVLLK
jgi:RHS repeat-associated protein